MKCASFFVALMLVGCADPQVKEAGAFAAQLIQGTDIDIDVRKAATGNVYALSIENAQWSSAFSDDDVLSVAALAFYNNLPNPEDAQYIKMSVGKDIRTISRTFTDAELKLADACIDRVSSFFIWHPKEGIEKLQPMVDPLFFPDSLIVKIGQSVVSQDSLDNGFVRSEVIGFKADTVVGIPVLTIKVNAVRKQNRRRYDAFVNQKDQRILLVVPADKN